MAPPRPLDLDLARVADGLVAHRLDGFVPPCTALRFGFGQSNPTYRITDARGRHWVLRRKPAGRLMSPTAHRIDREYRVMRALGAAGVDFPVPAMHLMAADDTHTVGAPFYVMGYVDGVVYEDVMLHSVPSTPAKYAILREAMRVLATLHSLDYRQLGLADLGREGQYYPRQIERMTQLARVQAEVGVAHAKSPGLALPSLTAARAPVPAIAGLEHLGPWFAANGPPDHTCLIHGDFKLDNLMYARSPAAKPGDAPSKPTVLALIDWELATLGHPLADLANFLMPWYHVGSTAATRRRAGPMEPLADRPPPLGLPDARELMAWYLADRAAMAAPTRSTPKRPSPLPLDADGVPCGFLAARVFSYVRVLVIMQGILARMVLGQASSQASSQAISQASSQASSHVASSSLPVSSEVPLVTHEAFDTLNARMLELIGQDPAAYGLAASGSAASAASGASGASSPRARL